MTRGRSQAGVALIQALIVSVVLALLLLQWTGNARDQIERARRLGQRMSLMVQTLDAEAVVLFTMLSRPRRTDGLEMPDGDRTWNFRGGPFPVGNSTIRIQDQSGLLDLPINASSTFERLVVAAGVDDRLGQRVVEELVRRKRGPDSGLLIADPCRGRPCPPIQYHAQLSFVPGLDESVMLRLASLTSLHPGASLNPATAPLAVLRAVVGPAKAETVGALRARGELDSSTLFRTTGLAPGETISLSAGPAFRIRVTTRGHELTVRRQGVYFVNPYATPPVVLWELSPASTGDDSR